MFYKKNYKPTVILKSYLKQKKFGGEGGTNCTIIIIKYFKSLIYIISKLNSCSKLCLCAW